MAFSQRLGEMRHCLAVSVLALVMSIFASAAGRAAQDRSRPSGDPVIQSMAWEQPDATSYAPTLGDPPTVLCDGNCTRNCVGCCNGNCPANCNGNCKT
jgi:hypothetical protein